jgi:hypothetical protein
VFGGAAGGFFQQLAPIISSTVTFWPASNFFCRPFCQVAKWSTQPSTVYSYLPVVSGVKEVSQWSLPRKVIGTSDHFSALRGRQSSIAFTSSCPSPNTSALMVNFSPMLRLTGNGRCRSAD